MRRWRVLAVAGVVFSSFIFLNCLPHVKEVRLAAEEALQEAEAATAKKKYPDLYNLAEQHLQEGKRQEFFFRWRLAAFEFAAARDTGELAAQYARGEAGPVCAPCPPPVTDWAWTPTPEKKEECETALKTCEADKAALEKKLKSAGAGRTVYVEKECAPCPPRPPEEKEESAAPESLLVGTFLIEPPPSLEPGTPGSAIIIRYGEALLEEKENEPTRLASEYQLRITVENVPAEIKTSSPARKFQPLPSPTGEWRVSLEVPSAWKGPVPLTLALTLRNVKTGREQKLPGVELKIPVAKAGEERKPAAEVTVEPRPEEEAHPSDWPLRLLSLLVGLTGGVAAGFFLAARRRKGGLGAA